jgi:hypothetical protein
MITISHRRQRPPHGAEVRPAARQRSRADLATLPCLYRLG